MRKVLGKICGWFSLFCASWLLAFNATAGVHFDLNVNVGAPGYFGPIPMVSGMVPQLWNVQPVIAVGPVVVAAEPIYLRVPNFQRRRSGSTTRKWRNTSRSISKNIIITTMMINKTPDE